MSNEKIAEKVARRYMVFRLSTFDFFEETERNYYNIYKKCNDTEEKENAKDNLYKEIQDFSGIRDIPKNKLYKDDTPDIRKTIVR